MAGHFPRAAALAALAAAAAAYVAAGPLGENLLWLLLPLLACAIAPAAGIAALLGLAALLPPPVLELMALGAAAGLVLRAGSSPAPPWAAARCALTILAGSLGLTLFRLGREWGSAFPAFLALGWTNLPVMEQSATEHTLRAGLLLVGGIAWCLLLRRSLRTPAAVGLAWIGWLGGFLVAAFSGLRQQGLAGAGDGAPMVFLDDRNASGSFLVLTLFVAAAQLMAHGSGTAGASVAFARRTLGILALPTAVILLLASGSKAAILAALMAAAGGGLWWGRASWRRMGAVAALLAVIAALLVVAGPLLLPEDSGSALQQLADPGFLIFYVREFRGRVWRAALDMALEYPWSGIGPGLLYRHLGAFHTEGGSGWRPLMENAHSTPLQVAAETGFLGLVALGWLALSALLATLRGSGRSLLLALGLVAFLITSLSGHPLVLSRHAFFFWSFLGILTATGGGGTAPGATPRRAPWLALAFLFCALVFQTPFMPCAPGLQVLPASAGIRIDPAAGFYPEERDGREGWRWMRSAGHLRLCAVSDRPPALSLSLAAFSDGRQLQVTGTSRFHHQATVQPWRANLQLPPLNLLDGRASLILRTTPGATRVSSVTGSSDDRAVSLQLFTITAATPPAGRD